MAMDTAGGQVRCICRGGMKVEIKKIAGMQNKRIQDPQAFLSSREPGSRCSFHLIL